MPAEFDSGAFVRRPAWHQEGVVLPAYVSIEQMQEEAGLTWTVSLKNLFAHDDDNNSVVAVPEKYGVMRSDTRDVLGVVGDRYEPIQNDLMFEFLDALLDDDDVEIETAGSLKGGRWVWAQARLGSEYMIDGDEHISYLTVASSHDGTLAFTAYPTNIRVVCANTFTAAYPTKGSLAYKIRHTRNSKALVGEARDALALTFKDQQQFIEDVDRLMNTPVRDDQWRGVLDAVMPLPDEDNRGYKPMERKRNEVISLYTQSPTIASYRGTSWGVVNAFNEWEQWGQSTRKGERKTERAMRQFLSGKGETYTSKTLASLARLGLARAGN